MDKITTYRQYVQDILKKYQALGDGSPVSEVETQLVFDKEHDHYQLVNIGWRQGKYRTYGCIVHVDIRDGKVWMQHDSTDYDFVGKFLEKGIPSEDIVLGFQSPSKRPYTGFAVG
ncbi:MAG: XisI protein [Anaerolineae bacterium]|nr:XisI protein [Anaerolineae bacterium]